MFNKKRLFVFIVFLLLLFFMMTFGSQGGEVVRVITRDVEFIDGYTKEVISKQTVEVGKPVVVPDAPDHDKCKFSGWYTEDNELYTDFDNIREDLKLHSGCAVNYYTVRFYDTISKKIIDTQSVKEGEDADAPGVPAHSGYTFVRWSKSFTNVKADLRVDTVYKADSAKYKVQYYTVTDGNATLYTTKTLSGIVGRNAKAEIIKIPGFTFDKTNVSNVLIGKVTTDGKLVLKVYYNASGIVVVIDPQCDDVGNTICTQPGEEPTEEPHEVGDKITLKALKRSYTLSYKEGNVEKPATPSTVTSKVVGYCKNSKSCTNRIPAGSEVTVTEDVTFYAIWEGSLEATVANGSDYKDNTTVYTFNTWKDGSKEVAPATKLTLSSDKELVADYETSARKYTLTINYVYKDGTAAAETYTATIANGDEYNVSSPKANKLGYSPEKTAVKGTMPAENHTEEVVYYADKDTAYTVEYYQKVVGKDEYTKIEDDTEYKKGETDKEVSLDKETLKGKYTGFTLNESKSKLSGKIAGDGSLVLSVYYDRTNYIVIVDPKCEDVGNKTCTQPGEEPTEEPHEFGDKVTLDKLSRTYTLSYSEGPVEHKQESQTVTSSVTKYCVNVENCTYPEEITNYVITGDVTFYAYWEGSLEVTVKTGESYQDATDVYTFRTWKDGSKEVAPETKLTLDSNKQLVADYTKSTRKYTLTIEYVYADGSEADTTKTSEVENGKDYNVTSKTITGYTADKPIVTGTMPTRDLTITVTYTANDLVFSCDNITKEYSVSDQTVTINPATNGTGNYTYSLTHDKFSINNDRLFTIKGKTDAGTYNVSVTATDSVSGVSATAVCYVTINRAKTGAKEGSCNTLTYTGSSQTLASGGENVTYENNSGIDAASYNVTVKLDKNYAWSDGSTDDMLLGCSIAPKEVAVTWGSTTEFTYNSNPQAPTASVETGVTGETMTVTRTQETNVGSYTSTASCTSVSGGQAKCSNYTLTNTTKAYTIIADNSIVIPTTNANCNSVTYNGAEQTLATATQGAPYTLSGATGIDAKEYTVTATLTDTANYKWSDNTTDAKTFKCSIAPKEVSVTWGTTTEFTYNGNPQAPTASVETGVTGEAMIVTRTAETNVGNYTSTASCSSVTGGQAKCSNYTLTNTTKAYTIVADSSTTIPTEALCNNVTYTGREQAIASAPSDATYTLSGHMQTNAGTYTVTATLTDTTNYTWTDGKTEAKTFSCTLKREKVELPTCSAKTYNGSEQTLFEAHTSGEYTNSVLAKIYAGNYDVSLTPTSNYMWNDETTTAKDVTCVINPKAITITAKDQTVTYGTEISKTVDYVTVATLATGDTLTGITLTQSTTDATTNGTITPSNAVIKKGETDVTSSYSIIYNTGNLTINTQSVEAPTCSDVTYNGTEQTLFAAHTTGGYTNPELKGTDVRTDNYTVTLTLDSNYHWSDNSTGNKTLTCKIKPLALTITAKPQTTTYGVSISKTVNDVTVATLVGSDVLDSITLTTSTENATTTGKITPSNAVIKRGTTVVTNNYDITYVDGNLTINTQSVEAPTCSDVTYNGIEQTLFEAHTTGGYTNPELKGTYVNDYTVTLTLNSNYHWSDNSTGNKTLTCKINKKAITITAKDQTITYGESIVNTVEKVDVATLATGDSLTGITLTQSTTNATTNGTITPSNAVIKKGTTDVTSNYDITYNTGKLVINNSNVGVSEGSCNSNLVYTGSPITLASGGTHVTYSNNSQTNAGTYTVIATADDNYAFEGGSKTKELTCTIARQSVEVPTCASQAYSGSELTLFAAHESGAYTNSVLVQTEVGSYDVELAVTDNYKWSDNTTTNKTVSCIINPIIIYNSNTGSGTMSNQTATYNTATTLNENTFTKTGHDFAGWNTQADGNGTSYDDKASVTLTNNLTLYAQWVPKKYTVQWNKVIGSTTTPLETDENVPYGSTPEYNGSTPTYSVQREDGNYTYTYTFVGWKDQDGNYLTNSTVITKDTTYTAQLVVLKAKYKYNMQNAFTRGESNDSVKDRIDVYVVDSTGTTVKTLNKNEYTTNFNAAALKKSENLIIDYNYSVNGQTYALTNNELYYSVVLHAHPTKFEVEMSVGNSYVESGSGCTGNPTSNSWCNVSGTNGSTTTTLDHNFLKVTEHYMQRINVKQIRVTYANGKTVLLKLSGRKNFSYYDYSWGLYEDPQYIAELIGYDLIDVYLKKSHTINANETFPDDAYTTQGNPISGTCKRGVSGYDSWTGKCTYYTFEPNTVKYNYNDRNNYYKLREDGTGYVNANVSRDEIDVEGVDREILYVSITYERYANPDEGEDAGYFRVDYEYVDGEFICTDEVEVNSTSMSADFDSNSTNKLYSAIGMSSRSRKMMMVKPLEEILEELTEDALIDDNETKEEVTPIEPEEIVKLEEVTETKEEIVKDETPVSEVKEEKTEEPKEEEKPSSLDETVEELKEDSNTNETTTEEVEEETTEVVEELPKEITPVGEVVEEKTIEEVVEEEEKVVIKEDTTTEKEDSKEEKKENKEEEKILKAEEKEEKKEQKEEEKESKKEVKEEKHEEKSSKTEEVVTTPTKKEEEEVKESQD